MAGESIAIHVKVGARLLARVDACAREEGISRPEWVRAALSAAALKSEQAAGRRARLEQRASAPTKETSE